MSASEITPEELAAWADGEIDGARSDEIAAAVEASPALQAEVDNHRALRNKLSAHFAPIAQEPVPDHLAELLRPKPADEHGEMSEGSAEIVSFGAAKKAREAKRTTPGWGWIAGPALAASIALAVFLPRGAETPGYAEAELASALDTQLVAEQGDAETRILLSFQNRDGEFCRAYSAATAGGIACRDDDGWRIETLGDGADGGDTDYRMAGAAEIMAEAQEMAAGEALDAEAERDAREAGWRP